MGRTRLQGTPLDSCLNLRTPEPMVNPRIQPVSGHFSHFAYRPGHFPDARRNSLRLRASRLSPTWTCPQGGRRRGAVSFGDGRRRSSGQEAIAKGLSYTCPKCKGCPSSHRSSMRPFETHVKFAV